MLEGIFRWGTLIDESGGSVWAHDEKGRGKLGISHLEEGGAQEIWSVKYCLPKENKILVLALLVEV